MSFAAKHEWQRNANESTKKIMLYVSDPSRLKAIGHAIIDFEVQRIAELIALKRFLNEFGIIVVNFEANQVNTSKNGIAKCLNVLNKPGFPEQNDDSLSKVA